MRIINWSTEGTSDLQMCVWKSTTQGSLATRNWEGGGRDKIKREQERK